MAPWAFLQAIERARRTIHPGKQQGMAGKIKLPWIGRAKYRQGRDAEGTRYMHGSAVVGNKGIACCHHSAQITEGHFASQVNRVRRPLDQPRGCLALCSAARQEHLPALSMRPACQSG